MPNLDCRMYESRLPKVDEAVMIQVRRITDTGVYVALLEYNNIEGLIPETELSCRRIRSVASLVRIGRQETAIVLRVDHDKGYVDLSKRRVSDQDVRTCEDRYNKAKLVHSIMRHVADTVDLDLETVCERVAWPLYRKYGHAFDAFKLIAADPDDAILDPLTYNEETSGPDGEQVCLFACLFLLGFNFPLRPSRRAN
jgi:translation initiation factor 2 subunit 1